MATLETNRDPRAAHLFDCTWKHCSEPSTSDGGTRLRKSASIPLPTVTGPEVGSRNRTPSDRFQQVKERWWRHPATTGPRIWSCGHHLPSQHRRPAQRENWPCNKLAHRQREVNGSQTSLVARSWTKVRLLSQASVAIDRKLLEEKLLGRHSTMNRQLVRSAAPWRYRGNRQPKIPQLSGPGANR